MLDADDDSWDWGWADGFMLPEKVDDESDQSDDSEYEKVKLMGKGVLHVAADDNLDIALQSRERFQLTEEGCLKFSQW